MSSVRMTPRGLPFLALAAVLALATSCSPSNGVLDPGQPGESSPVQLAKGGKGGGGGDAGSTTTLTGTINSTDFTGESAPLQSTCPTVVKVGQWHLDFGSDGCLVVTLTWNDQSGFAPYELTDDVKLLVQKESGKNGRITHVTLVGQDVVGEAGIGHRTDAIPVDQPVVPNKAGFTLHVHASMVPVYRLDSHLFDGNRVALIGWVSIGDAVYSTQ